MRATVMIDGQLVASEGARVSVFDRGFLYGDSVFESLRSYHGVPFALDEHLARLTQSAERVALALPVSVDTLRSELLHALSEHGNPESYMRLTLTRGVGRSMGLDPDLAEQSLRVAIVTDLALPPAEMYELGISAITYRAERPSDVAGVADAKIGNYLLAVMAAREARARGAREALIEDGKGQVLEGASSNVFAVFSGVLVTAPDTAAILPGITRRHVLSLAQSQGLEIELRAIAKSELASAEEVFVTSSLRELVPVATIDGQSVGNGRPGAISHELLRAYREIATPRAK
ncbi:MAG TPA: aminotransferase class IV [Polyangiaceae bacterium]|nr:aminotransferase class IV [Polyangiaceae bacterium]